MTRPPLGPFGFIATSIGCALSLGLLVITATLLGVEAIRLRAAGTSTTGTAFYLLVGGTLAGIFLAGFAAWHLLAPIPSTYRRGGLSMVCGFATVILMLICVPVHEFLGRNGLYALLGVAGGATVILGHLALRVRAGS
jgi:hypothetical protein